MEITLTNNDSSHSVSVVSIQPMLCYVGVDATKTRKQHRWSIFFAVDSYENGGASHYHGPDMGAYLPNNTAGSTVEANGELIMQKGVWYKWGSPFKKTLTNDGTSHKFGCSMVCYDTQPRYCPPLKNNAYDYIFTPSITLAKYIPPEDKPPVPEGVSASFDKTNRSLIYWWDDANCAYVKIYRSYYSANGAMLRNEEVLSLDTQTKFYNDDKNAERVKETVPDDVAKVTWRVVNYNNTGAATSSASYTIATVSEAMVWVKANGTWRKAIPWVKVNGTWTKDNIKIWVKVNGTWKRTTV